MKILHVIASLAPRYGGPSKACVEMAAALAARGHEMHIFTTDQDGTGRLNVNTHRPTYVDGVHVHYFRSTLRVGWPLSIDMGRALASQIWTFDLVHIHSLYLSYGLIAAHHCRKSGTPYIVRPHGTLDPYLHRRHRFRKRIYEFFVENRNLRGAAGIHFTTEEERNLALPYTQGAPSFVVPLGIRIDDYIDLPRQGTFRSEYPEIGNRKILLHLGRINFKKGLDILVRAFARLVQSGSDLHLVIAGPDNEGYAAQVRGWLADLKLSDRATFVGMLQGPKKLAALRDANVFALPSYSENFGIAVLEALACELPVVISNKVNIWKDLRTANAGLVVECDDRQCATAIERLLEDSALAQRMGRNGREMIAARFSWSAVAQQLEGIYGDILLRRLGQQR